jgi:hypothetical protein
MKHLLARLPALFLLTAQPILAQEPAASQIEAVGARVALNNGCGLRAADDGTGLTGAGAAYRVALSARGMLYEPALGASCPTTQRLALAARAIERGDTELALTAPAPTQSGLRAEFGYAPGIVERCDVRPEGVEVSWQFDSRPAGRGDLVVRYAVDTSLGEPSAHAGGLAFVGDHGGVTIGAVTGIDANGERVAGSMQWQHGELALSLPASFVDTAAYPIVLDPLVGTSFGVATAGVDSQPDVAFDATTNRYLVVWMRTFSATDTDPHAQLVTTGGALSGALLVLDASISLATPPRVANLGVRDRFGVTWAQTNGTNHNVYFRSVEAGNGALGTQFSVATTTAAAYASADIGCQTEAPIGTARGFVVTYEDNDLAAIRARRIWYSSADVQTTSLSFSIWTNSTFPVPTFYAQPQIARATADVGELLVVARRSGLAGGGSTIVGTVVNAGSNTLGAGGNIATSATSDLANPDVDGYGGAWVVAWEANTSGAAVRFAPATLNATATALVVGGASGFGGTLFGTASAPTVAYTPGRTWLGYRSVTSIGPTTTNRVVALDSASCANCVDSFSTTTQGGPRIVVGTGTSGGATAFEGALAVWHDAGDDISGQRLINHGSGGTTANLGGGCGSVGNVSVNHAPGIGSSGFRCNLNGVPATVLAAIFNFSVPAATVPCGPCVWTPFSITLSPPILGTSAFVEFPIPCVPSIVGSVFETQWTGIDFGQAPCPTFPGLVLSNRTQLTIGN